MHKALTIAAAGLLAVCTAAAGGTGEDPARIPPTNERGGTLQMAQGGRSCRAVSTCREAVVLWCGGYSRADADDDGIPCENVCRSRAQVDAIKDEIGC